MTAVRTLAFVCLFAGCSKAAEVTPSTRAIFKARCMPCHGETGRGDGPAVAKLGIKPPDFSDTSWQRGVTDDELRNAIVYGGAAVGKGSAMPAGHDLGARPALDALVALVRSFARR